MSYYFYQHNRRDYDFGCWMFLLCVILAGIGLFVLPVALTVVALLIVSRLLRVYLNGLTSALGLGKEPAHETDIPAPPAQHTDGRDPAWPHYLYGPAKADLRNAGTVIRPMVLGTIRADGTWLRDKIFKPRDRNRIFRRPIGVVIGLGMVAGDLLGLMAVAVLAVVQMTAWALLAAGGYATIRSLRLVDTGMLRIKRIGLYCQSCHQKVAYPAYACPGCDRRHHDIRPGRYGMTRRACVCGERFPTLLMLGSSRMDAYCPVSNCGASMSRTAGKAPDSVLPILGSPQSGKTRLMLAVVRSLVDGRASHGATADFADEESRKVYEKFVPALVNGIDTWKTQRSGDRPLRSYSLTIKPPKGSPRLLHIYDPPGEVVETAKELQAQRFLQAARTFLFVLDPLSIPAVWNNLSVQEQKTLTGHRSQMSPQHVFNQILVTIQTLGVSAKRARLAVAITKHDLVGKYLPSADGDGLRDWLESDEIGLDNMVRSMNRAFSEVVFFRTSSWLDDNGDIDPNIPTLTSWILRNEGLRLYD